MSESTPPDLDLDAQLDRCEQLIGYRFHDRQLLQSALTHASGAETRLTSNERLEFLGDAILGAIICEELFHRFPEFLEGDLTKIKSIIVSRQTCARISRQMGLEKCLIVGKGMAANPQVPPSLLADVFESLLAAIYLDGGHDKAREFLHEYLVPEIELAYSGQLGGNYKSVLQQLAQREHGSTPVYQLIDEQGPDHAKCFRIAAQVGGTAFSPAWGRNKKEAEQRAAANALSELRGETAPFDDDRQPTRN